MAFYEGLPHAPFKGINLKSGDGGGLLRFHGTTTITPSEAAGLYLYVKFLGDKKVLHFWDGSENRPTEPGFMNVQSVTATTTLTVQDCGVILASANSNSVALTLPDPAIALEGMFLIKNIGASGAVNVKAAANDGIDGTAGGSNYVLNDRYDGVIVASDGVATWYIMSVIGI